MSEDRCVCCGEIVAEGRQVCQRCLAGERIKPDGWLMRDVAMIPQRKSMCIGYRYFCRECGEEVRFETDRYCPSCGQRQNWGKWK